MTHKNHKYPPPEKTPSEIDWARLASFIDGEGCIRISDKPSYSKNARRVMFLQVNISNTDPRLPQWLKETFGGGVWMSNRSAKLNVNWANCFAWIVSCRHAQEILERCLPYFIVKRDQAEIAIAFQKTIQNGKGRTRRTPDDVVARRNELRNTLSELKGRSSRRGAYKERNETMDQIPIPDGLIN